MNTRRNFYAYVSNNGKNDDSDITIPIPTVLDGVTVYYAIPFNSFDNHGIEGNAFGVTLPKSGAYQINYYVDCFSDVVPAEFSRLAIGLLNSNGYNIISESVAAVQINTTNNYSVIVHGKKGDQLQIFNVDTINDIVLYNDSARRPGVKYPSMCASMTITYLGC